MMMIAFRCVPEYSFSSTLVRQHRDRLLPGAPVRQELVRRALAPVVAVAVGALGRPLAVEAAKAEPTLVGDPRRVDRSALG